MVSTAAIYARGTSTMVGDSVPKRPGHVSSCRARASDLWEGL